MKTTLTLLILSISSITLFAQFGSELSEKTVSKETLNLKHVGGVDIVFPSPNKDYQILPSEYNFWIEQFVSSSNKLICSFHSKADIISINAGNIPTMDKYIMVQISKENEYKNISKEWFANLLVYAEENLTTSILSMQEEALDEVNTKLNLMDFEKIEINELIDLGTFYETENTLASLSLCKLSQNKNIKTYLGSMLFIRLKERLIFIYFYTEYVDKNSIYEITNLTIDYSNELLEINDKYKNNVEQGNRETKEKNYESANAAYNEAIASEPDNVIAYIERANLRNIAGDYEGALSDCNKVIELSPDNALGYYNRGLIQNQKGYYNEALKDYNIAIELNPNYYEAYSNRATIKHQIGGYESAIQDCNKAISINPDYAIAYANRATSKLALNKFHSALSDCNKAILLDPNFTTALYTRAAIKISLDDYTGAISDCNKAINLDSQCIEAYINRAIAKNLNEDYHGAISDCNNVLKYNPNHAYAYLNRGMAKLMLGEDSSACSDIKIAASYGLNDAKTLLDDFCK